MSDNLAALKWIKFGQQRNVCNYTGEYNSIRSIENIQHKKRVCFMVPNQQIYRKYQALKRVCFMVPWQLIIQMHTINLKTFFEIAPKYIDTQQIL